MLDFDDLLHMTRDLLRRDPLVRNAAAKRFTRLLVDEFQDTDPIRPKSFSCSPEKAIQHRVGGSNPCSPVGSLGRCPEAGNLSVSWR